MPKDAKCYLAWVLSEVAPKFHLLEVGADTSAYKDKRRWCTNFPLFVTLAVFVLYSMECSISFLYIHLWLENLTTHHNTLFDDRPKTFLVFN